MSPTEQTEEKTERRPAKAAVYTRERERLAIPDAAPVLDEPLAPVKEVHIKEVSLEPVEEKKKSPVGRIIAFLIVISVLATAATVGVNYWLVQRQYESTDDAFIDGHIIPISPQVAARVLAVHIVDNQAVKAGDVLVELDKTDYQVTLDQKRAVEASVRGKLEEAKTQLDVAKANVGEAQAELDANRTNAANMEQDFKRYENLDPRARSQKDLDNATAAQRSTAAQVEQAQAKLTAAQTQVLSAQAAIVTAESDVAKAAADTHQAEIQLGYCTITAPQDGVITRKNVEPGMYVSVGQPLFSLVSTDMYVTANYKETQLDMMRPGQPVDIIVDAYPEKTYHGTLESIQRGAGSRFSLLPSENATGNFVKVVQRIPVKILIDQSELNDPDHPLAPGMSVEPNVKVRPWQSLRSILGF
jgi:membrane fusion protein (multidrug efflux system)